MRTARAKGLSRLASLWGHVLRNAMISVITIMGLQFASLLAGTIVVENVFHLAGTGTADLSVHRQPRRHRGAQLRHRLLAAMVIIVNFAVDVLHAP